MLIKTSTSQLFLSRSHAYPEFAGNSGTRPFLHTQWPVPRAALSQTLATPLPSSTTHTWASLGSGGPLQAPWQ